MKKDTKETLQIISFFLFMVIIPSVGFGIYTLTYNATSEPIDSGIIDGFRFDNDDGFQTIDEWFIFVNEKYYEVTHYTYSELNIGDNVTIHRQLGSNGCFRIEVI